MLYIQEVIRERTQTLKIPNRIIREREMEDDAHFEDAEQEYESYEPTDEEIEQHDRQRYET